MKKLMLALILIAAAVPAGAEARPGALDPSFGDDGRVVKGVDFPGAWDTAAPALAKLPGGGAAILADTRLFAFDPDGTPMRRFGGGVVKVVPPPGVSLVLLDVVADPRGILVAGTAVREAAGVSDSDVFLARYRPDGTLDPGFGDEGVLLTDLGLPPPSLVPKSSPSSGAAQTALGDLALLGDGRIVLAAVRTSSIGPCKSAPSFSYTETVVARLTEDGELDPAFAQGGTAHVPELVLPSLALNKNGGIYLWGANNSGCTPGNGMNLVRLGVNGNQDEERGFFVAEESPDFTLGSMAVDHAGRVLLWGDRYIPRSERRRGHLLAVVRRFLPGGRLDVRFGTEGTARLAAPRGHSFAGHGLALDASGRIVLAGTSWPVRSGSSPRSFMVGRLLRNGRIDRRFGAEGSVRTRFGKRSLAEASSLAIVGGGRLLVAGAVSRLTFPGEGLALARYLSR